MELPISSMTGGRAGVGAGDATVPGEGEAPGGGGELADDEYTGEV